MHVNLQPTFGHTVWERGPRHQPAFASKPDKVPRTLTVTHPATRHMTMHDTDCCREEFLSVFNQCSPRVYIAVVLCFPCDDRRREDAIQHIQQSLRRLAKEHPIFASRLRTNNNGKIILKRCCAYDIPFEVVSGEDGEEELDYEQLRRDGFPPGTFIHPRYGISGLNNDNHGPLPLSKVEVSFARGGLLLSIFVQHAITDGSSLRVFLQALGNQTRHMSGRLPSEQRLPIPIPGLHSPANRKLSEAPTFKRLVASCTEYNTLTDLSGPTQPRPQTTGRPISDLNKIGKIFVFNAEKLDELRELIKETNGSDALPTAYISLATLAFSHITKARIKTEPALTGIEPSQTAMLWNSVNWRPRAFPGATDNYFGNAVLPAVTRVSREHLNAAALDYKELAYLAPVVKESIDAVDQKYVSRRMLMMSLAPDPRMVGVNYDPRSPETLAVNTWRHFGADVEWDIPGVPVSRPDTIRRATGGWGLGTALILPARADSGRQELFVSLSVDAMEALCQDRRWMQWVDRVIG
ncbi:hypothetical protein F4777DRAFT_567562 [Nemania sp. FL0916]|nr:hypothetical protein F4777DRAFT_567562 [Nemania sp. FL0916]